MRKRIQQLAGGEFEYAEPFLTFSKDKVGLEVLEGKDGTGDFEITSTDERPIRGCVYTSDDRMECLTPQFEGVRVRIRYKFHSNGLVEGDIRKGEFFLITDRGEYDLSFVVSVSKLYAETAVGKIKNLDHFTAFAQENFSEASRLFYSQHFKNIIKASEKDIRLVYKGMSKGSSSLQRVEEFLVATGKKEQMKILPETTQTTVYGIWENRLEHIHLRRTTWGHVEISVTTDAAFLVPEKCLLTEEDFIGSVCDCAYYIRSKALHAGKNWGCIHMTAPGWSFSYTVCASREAEKEQGSLSEHQKINHAKNSVITLYIEYRLKKIVTGVWASRSVASLNELISLEPDNALYPLMKAQCLFVNKQKQEASWIMDEYKKSKRGEGTPVWGYYLYICTLMEREPSYVDRLTRQIEELFHKNPDSSLLFWVRLFVKEEYCGNPMRKFRAIARWVEKGNRSPYFYLEAYYLIWQDPYLMGRLDRFSLEVLNWAVKQNFLTKEIAQVVVNFVTGKRDFDPMLGRILESCYEAEPTDEMLSAICGYLIRGQRFARKYHKWYALGVKKELRITGMYEAFLLSMDEREVHTVPKIIQLYFQYECTLPYQQKAALFVNIIVSREKQPEMYRRYQKMIEQFAFAQIDAGHINDNLAVIYQDVLKNAVFSEVLAQKAARILFTHKLVCSDRSISRVLVLHRQLKEPQSVPLIGGVAYFSAYTVDYAVILEDNRGNRFVHGIPYREEPLINPEVCFEECMRLASESVEYLLYYFYGKNRAEGKKVLCEEDEVYLTSLFLSDGLTKSFRAKLYAKIVRYYHKKGEWEKLKPYLSDTLLDRLPAKEKGRVAELLVEHHIFGRASELVQLYGYESMKPETRIALLNHMLSINDGTEDEFILEFALRTWQQGAESAIILEYLCQNYSGPTKQMAEIWKNAKKHAIETFELEERILTQMLYTSEYVPYVEQIYESYCAGGGRPNLCQAYLSWQSHSYIKNDTPIPEHVFFQLEKCYRDGQDINDTCLAALLKYYGEKSKATGELHGKQYQTADEILERFVVANRYFVFYRNFTGSLAEKYRFHDKYLIEYHTAGKSKVTLHFRIDEGEYRKEELPEVYEGIYCGGILLFFGETVQYYITEEKDGKWYVTESDCIYRDSMAYRSTKERYVMLDKIIERTTNGPEEGLVEFMKEYAWMQSMTDHVFTLL